MALSDNPLYELATKRRDSDVTFNAFMGCCRECGSSNLYMSEGCMICQDCGWSECG